MKTAEETHATAAPAVIGYASRDQGDFVLSPELVRAANWMIVLAIFSGFCVGSWFLFLSSGAWVPGSDEEMKLKVAGLLHAGIYGFTIAVAVQVGRLLKLAGASTPGLMILDAIAGVGLLVMGVWPLFVTGDTARQRLPLSILAAAFAMLAATTYRHVLLYTRLAGFLTIGRRASRRGLSALGHTKALYEGVWLSCCAVTLGAEPLERFVGLRSDFRFVFAIASLLGCFPYIAIWLWSFGAHLRYARLLRQSPNEFL